MIDILIAVDGEKLAQQVSDKSLQPGTAANPTNLGAWGTSDVYISMIAQHSVATNDQGQSELTVSANSGDTIRWSMTTFGSNIDTTAFLIAGHFNPSTVITPLILSNIQETIYLPSGQSPSSAVKEYLNQIYVGMATVLSPGNKIQYTLTFELVDNHNSGKTIGYFTWDPFIQVNV